jgi:hypothetical protein
MPQPVTEPAPEPGPRYWRRLYVLVLGVLVVEIVLFWVVTRAFS